MNETVQLPEAGASFTSDQIDKLMKLANQPTKRWWTDYPFIVSSLAFVLSLVVTTISGIVAYRKDIHDRQTELSARVQSLQEETEKLYDLRDRDRAANTSLYADPRNGFITARMMSTLRSGADLALGLGTSALVPDLLTISDGLQSMGDFTRARQLLQTAVSASITVEDRQISLRGLGNLMINGLGGPAQRKEGDDMFRRSLALEVEFPFLVDVPRTLAYLKASAEISWAMSLAKTDCGESKRHLATGLDYLTRQGGGFPD